ncbi:MAG TPA: hypothetical protein VD866_13300, partial [Urbifossiella sp.]|nr:hypothetical protein [Urbifossiella sp.]
AAPKGATLKVWDIPSGRLLFDLDPRGEHHQAPVRAVAFSPDGSLVVSGATLHHYPVNSFREIVVWNAQSGAALWRKKEDRGHRNSSVAFSPDGTVVALATDGAATRCWDARTGADRGRV